MDITDFASLLTVAKQQPEPQTLLFLFLEKSLSNENKGQNQQSFNASRGGELTPVMTLEKPLNELTSFADLVAESHDQKQNWHVVLIGALSGSNGIQPNTSIAAHYLDEMIKTVENGGNLSKYLAFDQEGNAIVFQ